MNEYCLEPKEISIKELERIGIGRAAEVYKDGDKVVKLYYEQQPRQMIEQFYKTSCYIMKFDIPVTRNYGFVTCEGRFGIIYDYVNGKSLDVYYEKNKDDQMKCAREMGRLMRQLHSLSADPEGISYTKNGMLSLLGQYGFLTNEQYEELSELLEQMPGPRTMVHGDFHEGNFMMSDQGPLMIDLDTICTGSPLVDLGYMYLAHKMPSEEQLKERYGITKEEMEEAMLVFLEEYFETKDRQLLLLYDELILHMAGFYEFVYSLRSQREKGEEAYLRHVQAQYPHAVEELKKTAEMMEKTRWKNYALS